MWVKLVAILAFLSVATEAKYIRFNNTGTQDFLYVISADGHPPNSPTLLAAGDFEELVTLDEWQGSFYVLPVNCSNPDDCNYPVTVISVAWGVMTWGNFYDHYILQIVNGFNAKASIKSLTNPNCYPVSCYEDILSQCPDESQVLDEANVLVSCLGTPFVFKSACPDALVYHQDLNIYPCLDDYYEVTFESNW